MQFHNHNRIFLKTLYWFLFVHQIMQFQLDGWYLMLVTSIYIRGIVYIAHADLDPRSACSWVGFGVGHNENNCINIQH